MQGSLRLSHDIFSQTRKKSKISNANHDKKRRRSSDDLVSLLRERPEKENKQKGRVNGT